MVFFDIIQENIQGNMGRGILRPSYTTDPHYLWIPYLWIHLLAKMYLLKPKSILTEHLRSSMGMQSWESQWAKERRENENKLLQFPFHFWFCFLWRPAAHSGSWVFMKHPNTLAINGHCLFRTEHVCFCYL